MHRDHSPKLRALMKIINYTSIADLSKWSIVHWILLRKFNA